MDNKVDDLLSPVGAPNVTLDGRGVFSKNNRIGSIVSAVNGVLKVRIGDVVPVELMTQSVAFDLCRQCGTKVLQVVFKSSDVDGPVIDPFNSGFDRGY